MSRRWGRHDSGGSRHTRWLRWLGVAVVLAIAALAVLAVSLWSVRGDAEDARADLAAALDALRADDLPAAQEHVRSARLHIDDADADAHGLPGDVWSKVPVGGTAVDDVRHLVTALDEAVSVAEIGVAVYPSVAGDEATLFRGDTLDLPTLASVTAAVTRAGEHVLAADRALDEVSGSTPIVGGSITAKRDEAAAAIEPAAQAYRELEPTLDDLPAIFGAEGERTYLIAMLNPAELRYSGGATLAFAPMTWSDGRMEVGKALDLDTNPRLDNPIRWRAVRGNRFHSDEPLRMRNATFAPSWSVAGEELLRAWGSATGVRYDGVLAVDVVTLARLFALTGPVTVPGYGELTGDNLTETLIASYDDYYPDPTVRDDLSARIVPVFKEKLVEGGDYMRKGRVLAEAADGRHLALYLRDAAGQQAVTALGLDGDLAEPDGDYLGVFTQNLNGSKVDYYQRRSVVDEISLRPDGTAEHRLEVALHNDTPPYAAPVPDPRSWYFTRWAGMLVSTFVPFGTQVDEVLFDGEPRGEGLRRFRKHQFLARELLVEPQGRALVEVGYSVPGAVSIDGDRLTYRLAVDPQGLVNPQQLSLTVRLPDGYVASSVPEGWSVDGTALQFSTDALDASRQWEIVAEADGPAA